MDSHKKYLGTKINLKLCITECSKSFVENKSTFKGRAGGDKNSSNYGRPMQYPKTTLTLLVYLVLNFTFNVSSCLFLVILVIQYKPPYMANCLQDIRGVAFFTKAFISLPFETENEVFSRKSKQCIIRLWISLFSYCDFQKAAYFKP